MPSQAVRRPLTHIVATVGPASEQETMIGKLIEAGVGTFRLNFSHGTQQHHAAVYRRIRDVASRYGSDITILQDLQGPKLRVGELVDGGPVHLVDGQEFAICTKQIEGTAERVSTSYVDLGKDVVGLCHLVARRGDEGDRWVDGILHEQDRRLRMTRADDLDELWHPLGEHLGVRFGSESITKTAGFSSASSVASSASV